MTTLDPRSLRDAFGSFMTGVTVVTTRDAHGNPVGFTANSFTSVSLDPPLVLVCPGKFLSSFDAFTECAHFAVNVLAEGQEEVSNTFAGFKGDRFAAVSHSPNTQDIPLIDGALAQFSCITRQAIPAGDHVILLGEVLEFSHASGRGLGYANGQYFSLGLERAALDAAMGATLCGAIIEHGGFVLLQQTPEGFRPPQTALLNRNGQRRALMTEVARTGVEVRLGPAYSVFDDRRTGEQHAYFLATADGVGRLHPVALSDLPDLSYTSPAIADMMRRYAREALTQSFELYLGDSESGDIHELSKGT